MDTISQECICCAIESDCIEGLCQCCALFNHKLQKQTNLLTLGVIKGKNEIKRLETALKYAKSFIDGYGDARLKENLGREGMDVVLKEINKIIKHNG